LGLGQALGTGSDAVAGPARRPRFPISEWRPREETPPAAEELPPGQQPHRRQSERVRKIDFAQLDGLSTSADQELRETEDALVASVEQQAKHDALNVESREELKQEYEFGRMDGVA
jgi:hypothetical protein